jgi:hypothetical protein
MLDSSLYDQPHFAEWHGRRRGLNFLAKSSSQCDSAQVVGFTVVLPRVFKVKAFEIDRAIR